MHNVTLFGSNFDKAKIGLMKSNRHESKRDYIEDDEAIAAAK